LICRRQEVAGGVISGENLKIVECYVVVNFEFASSSCFRDIQKRLEEVDQFKYLGSTPTTHGTSVTEVEITLAQAHAAVTRLTLLCRNKIMSFY